MGTLTVNLQSHDKLTGSAKSGLSLARFLEGPGTVISYSPETSGTVSSCSLDDPWTVGSWSLECPGMVGSCSVEGSGMVSACSLGGPWTVCSCSIKGSGTENFCSLDGPWMVGSCSLEGFGTVSSCYLEDFCSIEGSCMMALAVVGPLDERKALKEEDKDIVFCENHNGRATRAILLQRVKANLSSVHQNDYHQRRDNNFRPLVELCNDNSLTFCELRTNSQFQRRPRRTSFEVISKKMKLVVTVRTAADPLVLCCHHLVINGPVYDIAIWNTIVLAPDMKESGSERSADGRGRLFPVEVLNTDTKNRLTLQKNELWGDSQTSADLIALGVYLKELTANDAWDHYLLSSQHHMSVVVSRPPLVPLGPQDPIMDPLRNLEHDPKPATPINLVGALPPPVSGDIISQSSDAKDVGYLHPLPDHVKDLVATPTSKASVQPVGALPLPGSGGAFPQAGGVGARQSKVKTPLQGLHMVVAGPSSAPLMGICGPVNQVGGALLNGISLRIVEERITPLRRFFYTDREVTVHLGDPASDRDALSWLEEQFAALLNLMQDHGVSADDHIGLI
uniref:Uncharacterized protein n=1 Tax=Timema shepardi TaxID=629360 RepID=A0A7R9G3W8_TIMSH|nr:unnamed protein product [Timema shepardi]